MPDSKPWWQQPTAESEKKGGGDDRRPTGGRGAKAAAVEPVEGSGLERSDSPPSASQEERGGRSGGRRDRDRRGRDAKTGDGDGRRERAAREEPPESERTPPAPTPHEITEAQIAAAARELVLDPEPPERTSSVNDERKIAMFCDLENIALGVRDSDIKKFDINLVLERLLEKGKIIVKKAYADWERYSEYKRPFHEAAIELYDIPQKHYSGKNSADIKMVVDAMDMCYAKEHLDTFVVVSGDSDFSPLVSKLKENNKYVIGVGVKNSSSNLLIDNCDEFIYYEDVWRDQQKPAQVSGVSKKAAEAFGLMIDAIHALIRENKDVLWGSMIKQTMQRKRPSFSEGYYGYGSFSELLEDAERKNIVKLKKDQRSGTYIVTGFSKQRG